ncbi:MAG: MFS transporter [Promethearchaeota archaeon]
MRLLNEFLGITELPIMGKRFIHIFLVFQMLNTFVLLLSNTFFILFTIDNIGFTQASLTVSFMLLVQLITDYPSGSLGDWLGQRWILAIAYTCYSAAFFMLVFAESFTSFLTIAFFNGLGNAQASGAINAWLDNNYQKVVGEADPERKIYGFSRARIVTTNRVASTFAFLIGGTLATNISRQFVFWVQAFMAGFMIVLILSFIKDAQTGTLSETPDKSSNAYFKHFVGGIKFLFASRAAFFFIIGSAIFFSSFTIWGNLLLFPIYFGYTGSDSLASLLRTIVFVIGVPISLYTAKVSRRLTSDKVPHVTFLFVLIFFPGFIILTSLAPLNNELNILACIGTILLMNGAIPTLFDLGATLRQRILIDMIPPENRNAVYSLIPSLISIFGVFLLPISGVFIEKSGIIIGVATAFGVGIAGAILIYFGIYYYKSNLQYKAKSKTVQPSSVAV